MKKLVFLFIFILVIGLVWGQTTLSAGDIIIIGFSGDTAPTGGENAKSFSWVPLVNLVEGTVINFTDSGWLGTSFRAFEGGAIYTVQSGGISAGTIIEAHGTTNTLWAENGEAWSAPPAGVGNNGMNFSTGGDQILAYQGDAATPTFVFSVNGASTGWSASGDPGDANQTSLPTGLTDGINCVACGYGDGNEDEYDNVWYSGSVISGTKEEILSAVSNDANWTGNNTSYGSLVTSFTVTPTGGNSLPAISSIVQDPDSDITSSTTVSVSADVTDSDGTITTVELHWGLSSGNLDTTISMSNGGTGDSYSTTSDIPAQSDDATVYYEIQATDDEPESATTVEYNYFVNDPETIPFAETFDNSSWPVGWTYADFTIENSSLAGGTPNEADLAYYNDNAGTSNITTPPINTSGETELILAWNQHLNYYEGGTGTGFVTQLLTSTDGSTFSNVAWSQTVTADETMLKQITLDSGDGVGSGTLYLRWFYYQNNTDRYSGWSIDDISFSGDSPTVISNVTSSPTSPNTTQTVSVSVDVTDTDGVTSVELHWGLSTGSLGTLITMTNSSGDTYTTSTDIPAQSEGATVYYEIYSVDNNTNSSTSNEFSYFVTDAVAPVLGDLLINEFDTNTSSLEYIELYNTSNSIINLSTDCSLVFYNGNGDVVYQTTDLTGIIPANGYYVVAETGVSNLYGYTPDQNASWTSFQNGTDGIALVYNENQIDAVIYGSIADTGLETVLSLPGILISNGSAGSSARITDGQGGTDYSNSDWEIQDTRSPGAANVLNSLDTPTNVVISHDGTNVTITWDAVTGSNSYNILSCETPDGIFVFEEIANTNSYTNAEALGKKFYQVEASTDIFEE